MTGPNKRKQIATFVLLLGIVLQFTGCAKTHDNSNAGAPGRKLVLGFSQMENNNPWRIAETNSMRDEAAKRADRFELVVTDAQSQTSKQVSDVEDLVARKVDAIFLAPREFEGLAPALEAAREAKIPVFLIDREASGTAGQDYVTFIGSNFIEQGTRAADWLVKQTNGRAAIVELTGTAGSSVARDRSQGFMEAIKSHPGMKIIASQTGDFSRASAQKVMENIIQSKGKVITAVYAHNDEMALGAIQALKAAGMNPGGDVLIVSIDGEKAALESIIRGEMNITVESNPRFGPKAFDTLEKFLRGETIPPKIILEDRFFDRSNSAQFLGEAY
ncbi:MAG TPA: ABC transporter substrate-binding protein [Pyrinomonadaceae bacterium]|jgi:ribose transport system substrate-binding protein|nr:ABC transporter substrate-binding protein [Pyrinomonadaceae bacterium]